jgi:hypothetical protein
MRVRSLLLVAVSPALGFARADEPNWAYVPAQRCARFVGELGIARPALEDVVKVVGAFEPAEMRDESLSSPVAFGPTKDGACETAAEKPTEPPIPSGAHWPKSDDTITVAADDRPGTAGSARARNPWEIRTDETSKRNASIFCCGGIIAGGPSGNVAIVNGRVARQGDLIDGYRVTIITPVDVILERDESTFVIPLEHNITIESNRG